MGNYGLQRRTDTQLLITRDELNGKTQEIIMFWIWKMNERQQYQRKKFEEKF